MCDNTGASLITDAAWGQVWARDTICLRERSMLTIARLAGPGNDHELAMHTRATANTGATRADVMKALLHVAIHAGGSAGQAGYRTSVPRSPNRRC